MTTQKEASHPLFYRVGSQRMRRTAVVAMYGVWFVIAVLDTLWSSTTRGFLGPTYIVVLTTFVLQLVWYVWLGRTYVNAPRLADAELDERLLQVKNRAYRSAYLVLAPVATIVWALSIAGQQWLPADQGNAGATVLLFGVFLLAGTLPTAIVAWREPDPEPLGS
jgi:hypothetical protein